MFFKVPLKGFLRVAEEQGQLRVRFVCKDAA